MARARNIKPGFFKNPELAELPFEYRLLYIGLWVLADREGRLEDRAKRIRMEVFPADDVDVEAGLHALAGKKQIVRYEVEGNAYVWIPAFLEHQHPHPKEVASAIPPYPGLVSGGMDDLFRQTQVRPDPADVLNPSSLNPSSSPTGTARATRIPPDWKPTDEQIVWACVQQPTWTPLHAERVGESFRDYWVAKAGKDAAKLDWDATWRVWVRKESPMRGANGPSAGQGERNKAAAAEFTRSMAERPE